LRLPVERQLPRVAALLAAAWLGGCASSQPALEELPARSLDTCAAAAFELAQGLDVAIAIDTSDSSGDPSGQDIDGNGVVGEFRRTEITDRADTLLAAQVAGVKSLVADARLSDLRLSIVSFSGKYRFDDPVSADLRPAVLHHPALTDDERELEEALGRVLARGSRGTTDLSAALRRSIDALNVREEQDPPRQRVVLVMSNSPGPILPGPTVYLYWSRLDGNPNGPYVRFDPRLATQAKRAIQSQVVVNTLGLGAAAEADTPHTLSRVAGATGGRYQAVKDPTRLHCDLMSSLVP